MPFAINMKMYILRIKIMKELNSEIKSDNQMINVLGKELPVFIRGHGNIPLLVLGQATLFKKPGFIPNPLDDYFKIYFVDLFEKQINQDFDDFSHLKLDDFLNAIEEIRLKLNLEKVALFSHSAPGVLAIEYSRKYEKNVLLNIIVATAPIWGTYKADLSNCFFKHNASFARKILFDADQKGLEIIEKKSFIHTYMARRTFFFSNPMDPFWESLWEGVYQDEALIGHFFQLIKDYDIRKTPNSDIPTFLALGLEDYSAPFYAWTDDVANNDHCFKPLDQCDSSGNVPQRAYYIFNSAHFPPIEDPDFSKKVLLFVNKFTECMPQHLSKPDSDDILGNILSP
jgi:proline iminopeptidase